MNIARMRERIINAAIAACASYLTLLSIQLWVAGANEFFILILGMTLYWYLPVVLVAFTIGAFVHSSYRRWGAIIGILTGIAGGFSIIHIIFSRI